MPPAAVRFMLGQNGLGTPTRALAAINCCSADRKSGLQDAAEGKPAGTCGGRG